MAVAYQSHTVATGSDDTTIIKPASLADGDFMIAMLGQGNNVSAGYTRTDWTALHSIDYGSGFLTILAKIADSTDAAASDFLFSTVNSSADTSLGALFRISGASFTSPAININSDTDTEDTDTTPTYTPGIAVRGASSLLMMGAFATGDATNTTSAYAIATDDPTWTERVDFDEAGSADSSLAIATATRTETTDTGTFGLTFAGTPTTTIGFILSIQESGAGVTVSPAVIDLTASIQAPAITGGAIVSPAVITVTASVQAPTVTAGTGKWSNKGKTGTATIANTSKTGTATVANTSKTDTSPVITNVSKT